MIAKVRISGLRALALLAAGLSLSAVANVPIENAGARRPDARASSVTTVRDHAELHRTGAYGNTFVEEGKVEGTLTGKVKVSLNINVTNLSATSRFAFLLKAGNVLGHANGKATTGKGGWTSFAGEMWIDRGTARYSNANGTGKMYGALERNSGVLVVQVIGHASGL